MNTAKRKILDVSDKITILEDVDTGLKTKDVATKYGIALSSVSSNIQMRTGGHRFWKVRYSRMTSVSGKTENAEIRLYR